VGFGTELLLALLLGFLILGPKQMNAMLGQMARAKAEFDKATRNLKSQLTAELQTPPSGPNHEPPRE
jgi:Sec-independent protein translocase protein TatA